MSGGQADPRAFVAVPAPASSLIARVAAALGSAHALLDPVAAGWGVTIYRATTPDGRAAVKAGTVPAGHFETEASMLVALAAGPMPAPKVLAVAPDMLVMEWIAHDGGPARPVHERQAGERLAALHALPRHAFGFPYDTPFGALAQPNAPLASWTEFFAERRLRHFAEVAARRGAIAAGLAGRIERLAARLATLIDEPDHPALLHGDLWTGNVLTRGREFAAVIDPALFCGHPEYELAYVTLHGTFGAPFFEAYGAVRPIDPGFAEARRDLYLIVPLLQHVLLSGPSYIHRIDRILARHGL